MLFTNADKVALTGAIGALACIGLFVLSFPATDGAFGQQVSDWMYTDAGYGDGFENKDVLMFRSAFGGLVSAIAFAGGIKAKQ